MLYHTTVQTRSSSLFGLSLLGLSLLCLSLPAASSVNDKKIAPDTVTSVTRSSTSISITQTSTLGKNKRDELLKNSDIDIMPALVKDGNRIEQNSASTNQSKSDKNDFSIGISSHNYRIFDADTKLISDFNFDGFYHRFSVSFDVDTVHDVSYIYAEVYLSYEGGPWNHYATSDNYHVYLDSETDTMTIETELADGFPPGYYDIRIEIYDADHHVWLLSYGPYDDASLSALPLEDSYYDDSNYIGDGYLSTELIVSGHGHGAMSWLLLLFPTLLIFYRTKKQRLLQKN